jgi:hypothetical protein
MTTTIGGSYPAVNSDSDATINGLTVGKGTGTTTQSTAFGTNALAGANTVGYNSAFGYGALATNTSGYNNTAVGNNAGGKITTGLDNTAIGVSALGYAGAGMTGSNNVAVGDFALTFNTSASNNTAVGYQAGYSLTTGGNNVLMGYYGGIGGAGSGLTTATANTFIGPSAGYLVTTGSKNTFLGAFSGNSGSLDLRTASNYIVLSDGDGNPRQVIDSSGNAIVGGTSTSSNESTYQGGGVFVSRRASSAGTTHANFLNGGSVVGSITSNTVATFYNTTSDYRLKENATPITNGLQTISALNPVNFDWISKNVSDTGFLAHEFQSVIPNSVMGTKDAIDANGNPVYQQMDRSGAIPFLVAAIKELKAEVDSLKQQLGK